MGEDAAAIDRAVRLHSEALAALDEEALERASTTSQAYTRLRDGWTTPSITTAGRSRQRKDFWDATIPTSP
jgi:hypothetical protein